MTFASQVEGVVYSQTERIPRPISDYQRPEFQYLPVDTTPTVDTTADDYLPRAHLKNAYQSGESSWEDLDAF